MPKSNTKARKNYDASFKLQVVLDSLQKDMTIEKVHVIPPPLKTSDNLT